VRKFHDILVPTPDALALDIIRAVCQSMRLTLWGPVLVFYGFSLVAPNAASKAYILVLGTCYFVVATANQIQLRRVVVRAATATLNRVALQRALSYHLLAFLCFGLLLAAVPWVIDAKHSVYSLLITNLLLIGFSFAQTVIHSPYPLAPNAAQVFVAISLAAYWTSSGLPNSTLMAIMVLASFVVSLRGAWVMGNLVHKSFRTRLELDDAVGKMARQANDLQNAFHQLRVAESEKLRLFSAANHDLRQPISAASLFIGVLGGRIDKIPAEFRPPLRDTLEKIDSTVIALDSIIGSISELTQLEAGRILAKPYRVDLQRLVYDLVDENEELAAARGVEIRPVIDPIALYTDPALLSRILRNLIDNCLKYAPNAPIDITLQSSQTGLVLKVSDRGPGIPANDMERVFQEYVQLDNPERDRSKGLGLGLPIVKRFAALLGLGIWLEARTHGGLSACIDLAPVLIQSEDTQQHTKPVEINDQRFDGIRVLVIDDEDNIRLGIQMLLGDWGCQVTGFGTAEFARHYLASASQAPHLILLDNRLPDAEGVEIAGVLRNLAPSALLVLFTGDTGGTVEDRANKAGLKLVYKPISAAKMRELLIDASKESR
jgi:signal transduction histidine kinase/CheY-like chemotaxis protein